MSLQIYDTLTRKKEEFVPLTAGKVKMYVCGVTVYDYPHLGHGRAYVAFDVIYRYLKYLGYQVTYVRNVTDIDDKIIVRANELDLPGKSLQDKVKALTSKYLNEFHQDAVSLNLLPPTDEPKATAYMPQMIKIIKKLIEKGLAYVVSGNVYYQVSGFKQYGALSRRNPDELLAGARVELDERKRSPLDFSLWKEAKPDEPSWDSPWGPGRPGWHLECSAMSLDLLGEEFDIHGGGQDLIFPHHENEIAQSCGCTGKMPARYWIHNGFVTINREKMSKSLGNFFTLRDIFKKYDPMAVRFFLLSQHYRSPVDFSDQLLEDARSSLLRIEDCIRRVKDYLGGKSFTIEQSLAVELKDQFFSVMNDDFNTARALAVIFDIVRELNNNILDREEGAQIYTRLKVMDELLTNILGIKYTVAETISVAKDEDLELAKTDLENKLSGDLDQAVLLELLKARNYFRKTKKWHLADKVRQSLEKKGYILRDSSAGTEIIITK